MTDNLETETIEQLKLIIIEKEKVIAELNSQIAEMEKHLTGETKCQS